MITVIPMTDAFIDMSIYNITEDRPLAKQRMNTHSSIWYNESEG